MDNKRKIWDEIRSHVIIAFGLFLYVIAWCAFLIPNEIVGGGVSGVGSLIFFATKVPVGVSILVINSVLLAGAIKLLGLKFAIRTIYGVAVLSTFFTVFQPLITKPVIDDLFMATVLGGLLAGAGIGIVFWQGGSSGGTDIIVMAINKYKNISPGKLVMFTDVLIIASSYLILHSVERIVYGVVTLALTSYAIDFVLSGSRQSYQVFIFSKRYENIAARISSDLRRGVTLLDGQGWYSKERTQILMIVLRKSETADLMRIVKQEDPQAFISMGSVMGVYGQGFDRIKL
ncbi:MAG TPA: YitT family protein [Bacteroidales bacterium]|nr:YitT family protein [Bacteroidales bacterium]